MANRPDPAHLRREAEQAEAALPALLLAAEKLAASALPGAHGERRAGMGEAFWQYRTAMPGDAAGGIDWRRSARSDSLFLREREAQSPRQAVLWVDHGAGMGWHSAPDLPVKQDRARLLALALGLALLRGGERVAVLGHKAQTGRAQADRLAADLFKPVALDAQDLRPGQRVLLISDWLGPDLGLLHQFLARAVAIGVGGAVLQILDPAEEAFPFAGAVDFLDASGRPAHRTRNAGGLQQAYLQRLAGRRAALGDLAAGADWRFGHFTTDEAASGALIWLAAALGVL